MEEIEDSANKFQKFYTGKLKLSIADEEFDLDLKVQERMPILQYLYLSSKKSKSEEFVNEKLIVDIKSKLLAAFSRTYPEVKKELIEEFVDKAFEQIIAEIAIASKWITREQLKAVVEEELKKNE